MIHNRIFAKAFTPSYDAMEDRIRLVVNYDDYINRIDLWITRSFLIKLLPVMDKYISKYDKADSYLPNENKLTSNVQTNKTEMQKIASKTDSSTFEVAKKEPLLLKSVDISYKAASNLFEIIFKTDSIQTRTIVNGTHARIIFKTIFDTVPKIEWGISPSLFE